jgi:hypothetical protein
MTGDGALRRRHDPRLDPAAASAYAAREMSLRPTLFDALAVLAMSALYGFIATWADRHVIALLVVVSYTAIVAWQQRRGGCNCTPGGDTE